MVEDPAAAELDVTQFSRPWSSTPAGAGLWRRKLADTW